MNEIYMTVPLKPEDDLTTEEPMTVPLKPEDDLTTEEPMTVPLKPDVPGEFSE